MAIIIPLLIKLIMRQDQAASRTVTTSATHIARKSVYRLQRQQKTRSGSSKQTQYYIHMLNTADQRITLQLITHVQLWCNGAEPALRSTRVCRSKHIRVSGQCHKKLNVAQTAEHEMHFILSLPCKSHRRRLSGADWEHQFTQWMVGCRSSLSSNRLRVKYYSIITEAPQWSWDWRLGEMCSIGASVADILYFIIIFSFFCFDCTLIFYSSFSKCVPFLGHLLLLLTAIMTVCDSCCCCSRGKSDIRGERGRRLDRKGEREDGRWMEQVE